MVRVIFGLFPGAWCLIVDVSEHCLFHLSRPLAYENGTDSVPKRRLLNTTRRGTTQKITRNKVHLVGR
jgi:hypothetical protein